MTVLSKTDTIEYFKELPFYKKPIEKPKVKRLKNIDLSAELPFFEKLSIIKLIKPLVDMQCLTRLK